MQPFSLVKVKLKYSAVISPDGRVPISRKHRKLPANTIAGIESHDRGSSVPDGEATYVAHRTKRDNNGSSSGETKPRSIRKRGKSECYTADNCSNSRQYFPNLSFFRFPLDENR